MSTTYTTFRDIETRIEKIDERLSAGIESVTTDGTSTKVNLESLRKERDYLVQKLKSVQPHATLRRPVASRIDLGGF